ncbi:hypothetical protein P7B04_26020 [Sphingobium yanoikuyae]|jgi:hypothetical protein|uniref:Phasin domain-containing protein n=1 Tax=Sphingobium yanoikuyae TaxID=13690 RepID=A0A3G2ULL5_SPHYA|nr:hypothetical protein [Sphingobium yanoikuyae]AYO75504.1 hypothetical protein EBF16_00400 [Sphingobium yanoikuyae]MDG2516124.1 hypothetical protein [Sphingobium yanoikuyae]
MTYPFDQMLALTQANAHLALKFAKIARANCEDHVQIGSRFLGAVADQFKESAPGKVEFANSEAVSGLFEELAETRTTALLGVKEAMAEWQQSCINEVTAPKTIDVSTEGMGRWFFPFGAFSAGGTAAKAVENGKQDAKAA